jgi:hypothetical protein
MGKLFQRENGLPGREKGEIFHVLFNFCNYSS